jgi:hypothetical protein
VGCVILSLRRIRYSGRTTSRGCFGRQALREASLRAERMGASSHENVRGASRGEHFMAAGGSWDPWIPQDDASL